MIAESGLKLAENLLGGLRRGRNHISISPEIINSITTYLLSNNITADCKVYYDHGIDLNKGVYLVIGDGYDISQILCCSLKLDLNGCIVKQNEFAPIQAPPTQQFIDGIMANGCIKIDLQAEP